MDRPHARRQRHLATGKTAFHSKFIASVPYLHVFVVLLLTRTETSAASGLKGSIVQPQVPAWSDSTAFDRAYGSFVSKAGRALPFGLVGARLTGVRLTCNSKPPLQGSNLVDSAVVVVVRRCVCVAVSAV